MLVSAISQKSNVVCNNLYSGLPHFQLKRNEFACDTAFNSLSPLNKKNITDPDEEILPIVYDSVNQWKNFCEHKVLGGKLNIIA